MTSEVRVIRFTQVAERPAPGLEGPVTVANVLLGEPPMPAGQIVAQAGAWHYLLAAGERSGLTSTVSRRDLEQQVILYHFGELPESNAGEPVLKLAV